MLFKVTDIKGDDRWINPTYVRLIRWRRKKTELWIAGQNHAIYVDRPLDDVASVVNAAMPLVDAVPGELGGGPTDDQVAMLTMLSAIT